EPGHAVQAWSLGLTSTPGAALPEEEEEEVSTQYSLSNSGNGETGERLQSAESTAGGVVTATVPQVGGVVQTLEELEKQHILSVLRMTEGKRADAAEMLAISTRTLRNKISQYRLEGEFIP